MAVSSAPEAGPSRLPASNRQQTAATNSAEEMEGDDPRASLTLPAPAHGTGAAGHTEEGDDDGDEERMDYNVIQSFADKIQHLPSSADITDSTARISITIPKRGEKDFEPLQETVNLQDMMLQKSRQALFNALLGVRGGHSKSISHAVLTPSQPYPRLLVVHGHLFDTMGVTVRYPAWPGSKGKGKTCIELLPEEALYLLERGSLQIWVGPDVKTEEEEAAGLGQWSDEDFGVKGAIEMSVMEGFATFIGREGLTWEKYQAYAYLKRLGYTVHRSRRFIPGHFLASLASDPTPLDRQDPHLPPFRTWWLNIPDLIRQLYGRLRATGVSMAHTISAIGLGFGLDRWQSTRRKGTSLLRRWSGKTYASIFTHLRIVPAGHNQPLPCRPLDVLTSSIYDPLISNPYIPFFHVWKPTANWSKRVWDKGSDEGLRTQKPDYFITAIEARSTPLPTLSQLAEIFDQLPDEPKGPPKRHGPQYQRPPRHIPAKGPPASQPARETSGFSNLLSRLGLSPLLWSTSPSPHARQPTPNVNIGALRNGDRGLVVAVNDSGNTGWVRFGRTGFAEVPAI